MRASATRDAKASAGAYAAERRRCRRRAARNVAPVKASCPQLPTIYADGEQEADIRSARRGYGNVKPRLLQ